MRRAQAPRPAAPLPQYDQGIAFAAGTDPKVVNAVNEAVQGLKSQGGCGRLAPQAARQAGQRAGRRAPSPPAPCRPRAAPAGVLEGLQAQYIHPAARCKDSGVSETTSQVTFDQVRGTSLGEG